MSLTRNEWIEMWNDIRAIEVRIFKMYRGPGRKLMLTCSGRIKDKIESVVGQLSTGPAGTVENYPTEVKTTPSRMKMTLRMKAKKRR